MTHWFGTSSVVPGSLWPLCCSHSRISPVLRALKTYSDRELGNFPNHRVNRDAGATTGPLSHQSITWPYIHWLDTITVTAPRPPWACCMLLSYVGTVLSYLCGTSFNTSVTVWQESLKRSMCIVCRVGSVSLIKSRL